MDFERPHRPMKEINLTALIDIVFHLLVFVMLTTSFVVTESMELSLPSAKAERVVPQSDVLRIEITPNGMVTIEQKALTLMQLSNLLAERIGDNPETKIAIFTTPGVRVQQLVSVMDAVYLTGGRNVQVAKVL